MSDDGKPPEDRGATIVPKAEPLPHDPQLITYLTPGFTDLRLVKWIRRKWAARRATKTA